MKLVIKFALEVKFDGEKYDGNNNIVLNTWVTADCATEQKWLLSERKRTSYVVYIYIGTYRRREKKSFGGCSRRPSVTRRIRVYRGASGGVSGGGVSIKITNGVYTV